MMRQTIRDWGVAILAILGAFLVAGVLGAVVASSLSRWDLPASGFAAAFAVVLAAYIAAPSRHITCAVTALVLGASIATWAFRDGSFYPESYETVAYQPTYLPLWLTVSGGVVGLLCVLAHAHLSRRHTSPNKTMEPTR